MFCLTSIKRKLACEDSVQFHSLISNTINLFRSSQDIPYGQVHIIKLREAFFNLVITNTHHMNPVLNFQASTTVYIKPLIFWDIMWCRMIYEA